MEKDRSKERLQIRTSSAVYIEDIEGRLLLLKQADEWKGGKWGPVAGGMEAHEDPIMVALREAREEIGVDVDLIDLIGIYTIDRDDGGTRIGFVFRGEIVSGEIKVRKGEIAEYRYFTSEEVAELLEEDKIYKPEYNLPSFRDWLRGTSYPIESIKAIK